MLLSIVLATPSEWANGSSSRAPLLIFTDEHASEHSNVEEIEDAKRSSFKLRRGSCCLPNFVSGNKECLRRRLLASSAAKQAADSPLCGGFWQT